MNLLDQMHGSRPLPRWAEAVRDEIEEAKLRGISHCGVVLANAWLDEPEEIGLADVVGVERIRAALTSPGESDKRNLGEAQSIFLAKRFEGFFFTDDNVAYSWARDSGMLPGHRVIDSVEVLRRAVGDTLITSNEARKIFDDVIKADRDFRREHPIDPPRDYFDR